MIAKLKGNLVALDGFDTRLDIPIDFQFGFTTLKQESVTINSATFQALTVPAGAKALYIDPGENISATLKGITGDTGVSLLPATNPLQVPVLLPLGTPSIGILNGAGVAQTFALIWFI